MKDLTLITVPFALIGIPFFETASIKAYLNNKGKKVRVEHLYLSFAETIGGERYRFLRTTDVGQAVFAAILHPTQHTKVKEWYLQKYHSSEFQFDTIVYDVRQMAEKQMKELKFTKKEKVLFYLYSQQLLPALYYAMRIKELYKSEIWFAGYHCNDRLAIGLQKSYPFIDKVFGRDIEESIYAVLDAQDNLEIADSLDILPSPDYSDFIEETKKCGKNFQKEIIQTPYFQVEFSRGCWWNKCSFCTLNCKNSKFREKSINAILKDYKTLIENYNTLNILVYQFVNNQNWKEILEALLAEYPGLYGTFDFNFKVSSLHEYEDFLLLKKTGSSILVGTENFDGEYLDKMNKGQRVIDNIQFLKYAERSGTACYHNLMYGMPYEKRKHLEKNKEIISYIYHLPPPFDNEAFRLTYGSDIYNNPEKYGIQNIFFRKEKEELWFPEEIKKTYLPFFYDFTAEDHTIEQRKEEWIQLIDNWRKVYYRYADEGNPKQVSLLSMRYAASFLQIIDKRYEDEIRNYLLRDVEKEIYLFCDKIRSFEEILNKFTEMKADKLKIILGEWCEKKIIYSENELYLSLAI